MIDYRIDGDGIATITWNVQNRPMNVLNEDTIAAFSEAVEKAAAADAVKGVIVASARPEFIVGADLSGLGTRPSKQQLYDVTLQAQAALRRIETCGKPFAAAINGHALGGGYEICLACHYRVAADAPRLKIGLPEAKLGLIPGSGGTQRLPRLIGIQPALPLMLEGKELDQQAALGAGMVDKLVPAESLAAEAKRWLLEDGPKHATKPWDAKGFRMPGGAVNSPKLAPVFVAGNAMLHAKTYGNYPAQTAIMSSVYEGCQLDFDTALKVEARYFVHAATTPEAQSMIRFFFAMTAANKGGRRPAAVPKADYAKVGVLGAGMMGAGIAYVAALAGIEVVLLDTSADKAAAGKAYSEKLVAGRVRRKRMTETDGQALLGRIRCTTDYADLAGAELVIEAVFEDRAVKAEVTKAAEAVLAEGAVFASNTSTLPITGLAEASARPAGFIGLHFFSPVDRMPLVEVIRGQATSDETLAKAIDFVTRIRKTPIVVNDSRGFFTSRVFATYVREGLAMLGEGVAPALIENAGRMAGMPVGPLALADEVSLELMHRVGSQTRADLGDKYPATPADPIVERMVESLGRPGKKAAKGFYDYPDDGSKRLWPGLAEQFPPAAEQPEVDEVIRRLMYVQSVETARCLEEGVVTDPADADVGSVMGWGFAPFKGGVIGQIETVGVADFVAECDRLAGAYGPRFSPPAKLRDMAAKGESFYAA